jgi:hypothetical protein
MRRTVLGLDRIAAVLLGLVLLALGVVTAAWSNGVLYRLWPQFPHQLSTGRTTEILNTTWWPWASGGVGGLAVLLGLWWLIAHLPRGRVGTLVLPGSGRSGRLLADPSGIAGTAAEVLAETPGIRSVRGRVHRDRGQLVIDLTATLDPRADLTDVIEATDAVATDLQSVLGRDDARARVLLTVARRARPRPRVQ